MIHCCDARPPPMSCSMAGKARLITVESRNATIDTITATTIARLVGAALRNVIAGAVRRVTMAGCQTRCGSPSLEMQHVVERHPPGTAEGRACVVGGGDGGGVIDVVGQAEDGP